MNSAYAVTIDMVTVGNPGNANDTASDVAAYNWGGIDYVYQMGKYEVTIGQYCEFLNAKAKTDPYSLYNTRMSGYTSGGLFRLDAAGIARSGTDGAYSYAPMAPAGYTPPGASSAANRPISWVTWINAARFTNWLQNGQGNGDTETGAYTIATGSIVSATRQGGVITYTTSSPLNLTPGYNVLIQGLTGTDFNSSKPVTSVPSPYQFTVSSTYSDAVATGTGSFTGVPRSRNVGATVFLPTGSEWYKAAYYSPILNSGSGGYYIYATQSNVLPGNTIGNQANQANYIVNGIYCVTNTGTVAPDQNLLTDAGAFSASSSYYGTFDQSGNVTEWVESPTSATGVGRGIMSWDYRTTSSYVTNYPSHEWASTGWWNLFSSNGFRVAAVPEPSTYAMVLAGLAGGLAVWRRRRA